MATVYVGRLSSAVGITRLVAIKRAHAHLLEDPSFAKMLIAEAKLASRIHHPNVVAVHNVEEIEGELLLVMDYVEGAALSDLMDEDDQPLPARVATRTLLDACAGLDAAHELTDDDGNRLEIVHRDVSPHNILVGVDGVARLTDFGIAKSSGSHTQSASRTSTGALKGKVAYMAPEYVESGRLDAGSDVFSLGVVAWEALTRQRLFRGATEVESLRLVLAAKVPPPSSVAPWLGTALDAVLAKALARDPSKRFRSAAELAEALETAARKDDLLAKHGDVAAHVRETSRQALAQRRDLIRARNGAVDLVEPPGREERTASIEVRAREDATAPAIGTVTFDGARTATVRTPAPPPPSTPSTESASVPPAVAASALVRGNALGGSGDLALTAGSGVAAHLVAEARRSPRRRASLWIGGGAIGIAGAATMIVLLRGAPSAGGSPGVASTTATAPPVTTTEMAPAPSAEIATVTSSSVLTPEATAPSASPPPSGPSTTTRGELEGLQPAGSGSAVASARRSTSAAPSRRTKPPSPPTSPIVSALPPEPPPDRAPPNPYAK